MGPFPYEGVDLKNNSLFQKTLMQAQRLRILLKLTTDFAQGRQDDENGKLIDIAVMSFAEDVSKEDTGSTTGLCEAGNQNCTGEGLTKMFLRLRHRGTTCMRQRRMMRCTQCKHESPSYSSSPASLMMIEANPDLTTFEKVVTHFFKSEDVYKWCYQDDGTGGECSEE